MPWLLGILLQGNPQEPGEAWRVAAPHGYMRKLNSIYSFVKSLLDSAIWLQLQ